MYDEFDILVGIDMDIIKKSILSLFEKQKG